jgi:5-histidylcysteine sulfoxide synthase/putative 4-mercaptohistidine N1-methyltranferase
VLIQARAKSSLSTDLTQRPEAIPFAGEAKLDDDLLKPLSSKEGPKTIDMKQPTETAPKRAHYEEWMENLNRGEDTWLSSARTKDWYTGKPPIHGICPGVSADGQLHSLPMPNLHSVTRKAAQEYFDNTWTMTEVLFAGFKGDEPFYRPPPHGLRHPQIFYYGHGPCLYINKLRVAGVLDVPVNPYFESIYEVGVDEMLWDDMHKNDMIWPTVAETKEYRQQVYKKVSEIIATHPSLDDANGTKPVRVGWDHPMWSLFMGFEHERIHLETSSVLFRETSIELMQVPSGWPSLHPSVARSTRFHGPPREGTDFPQNEMLPVAAGTVNIGKPRDFPSYGWDNEYGERIVDVPSFKASKHMITNGEFWHFVNAGGYRTEKYWSEDGWGWRKFRNMKWPFFWQKDGPEGSMMFRLRTIFEVTDMQWDWPVDVNYHEARAYCAWKSEQDSLEGKPEAYRVITEAEHHMIRDANALPANVRDSPMSDRAMWCGGEHTAKATERGAANTNLAYASQSPVGSLPPSPTGHFDVMGNAWEWCEDHFNPLDGFKVHYVYDDFSAPCFDGRHHMIMGGSFVSTGDNGASAFCRYHFRPHFLQHSGFRLVSSRDPAPATLLTQASSEAASEVVNNSVGTESGTYETKELVNQYLNLHFPSSGSSEGLEPILAHEGAPTHALRFPQRVAQLLASLNPPADGARALDIGCSVGGSSFELAAAGFNEVVAFDYSKAFIETAERMQRGEEVTFQVPMEGDLHARVVAKHEANVNTAARNQVRFQVGDACQLSKDAAALGTFDSIMLANLLCRLPDPQACLDGLRDVIKPDGVVVIVTPFSWLEEFTPRSKWLGGFEQQDGSGSVRSKEELAKQMEQRGFVKIHEEQMPLVIREHQRKYQYIVSEATAWRMKNPGSS